MDKIQEFTGCMNLTVSEAMRKIDQNAFGILFLTDEQGTLQACLTDGDVRRFLLSGGKMADPAMEAANKKPRTAGNLEDARSLYHQKNYIVIPILDATGAIQDLYFGDETQKEKNTKTPLNIPVVINAGGKGTRLDPFTRVLPKPLIPVGELPIIEQIIRGYQAWSCNHFHIIVNYKKELIKAYFADNENHYDITWHDEEKPLGTGGGLSLLRGSLEGTFFFANCDALLTANYESMLQFHRKNRNVVTMICAYKNLTIPYGVVEMGKNGTIESMQEKPSMSFLTNTGIYRVESEILEEIDHNVTDGFPEIIERVRQKGKKAAAFPVSENDWMDMGQLPELEKMRIRLSGDR